MSVKNHPKHRKWWESLVSFLYSFETPSTMAFRTSGLDGFMRRLVYGAIMV